MDARGAGNHAAHPGPGPPVEPPDTLRDFVLANFPLLGAIGGLIGATLASLGGRALSSVLYVGAFDPASFATAFAVLALVALVANAVPAWRAANVDPLVAIRHD